MYIKNEFHGGEQPGCISINVPEDNTQTPSVSVFSISPVSGLLKQATS